MASDILMNIGEALVGEGNEIAHIDLLIGNKDGPVGIAFANALANQSAGHTNLLAVLTPNLVVKPATVLITKVTIKGMKQAVQMFGPAQYAVAKAVADCVADGTIPCGRGRRPGHRLRRLHPPGRRRQRQDPQVQLRGHQALDPAGDEERAARSPRSPRRRTRSSTRSPSDPSVAGTRRAGRYAGRAGFRRLPLRLRDLPA